MTKSLRLKIGLSFACTALFFVLLLLYSMTAGSIPLTLSQLFKGLFVSFDQSVSVVYDLRFPRIAVAILAGAALAGEVLVEGDRLIQAPQAVLAQVQAHVPGAGHQVAADGLHHVLRQ